MASSPLIEYSQEQKAVDLDAVIRQAEQADPGQPIRLRIQPQIYVRGGGSKSGMYIAWKQVFWGLTLPTVADATLLRETLVALFECVKVIGLKDVKATLDNARRGVPEWAPAENEAGDLQGDLPASGDPDETIVP